MWRCRLDRVFWTGFRVAEAETSPGSEHVRKILGPLLCAPWIGCVCYNHSAMTAYDPFPVLNDSLCQNR
jgi:hypothetical protein